MPSERVYLDATVFFEALEGEPDKAEKLKALLEIFRQRRGQAVANEMVLAETMGRESLRVGWAAQSRFYLDLVVWSRFIRLVPISREVLWETGALRRAARQTGRSLRLADAMHVATAVGTGCAHILSSDARLAIPSPLVRVDPHAILCSEFEALLRA